MITKLLPSVFTIEIGGKTILSFTAINIRVGVTLHRRRCDHQDWPQVVKFKLGILEFLMPRLSIDVDKYLGIRLRSQRLIAGLSQEELGEKIGVKFRQIQKYENGTNRISASRMQQICLALQVPTSSIYDGPADATGDKRLILTSLYEFLATKEGLALVSGFQKISSPAVRSHIVELINELGKTAVANAIATTAQASTAVLAKQ